MTAAIPPVEAATVLRLCGAVAFCSFLFGWLLRGLAARVEQHEEAAALLRGPRKRSER